MSYKEAGNNTHSTHHNILTKASKKPVHEERTSFDLFEIYEGLNGKEQHHSHSTESLLMPIFNPSRQLLQKIPSLSFQLHHRTSPNGPKLQNWAQ